MIGIAAYVQSLGTFGAEPPPAPNVIYPTFAIIDALKATMGKVYLAAERLGCDPQTIYNRAKQEPVIELAMRMARGKTVDKAELKLEVALDNGEAWAIQMVLKTLGKDRGYVERHEVEDTTPPPPDPDLAKLNGRDLRTLHLLRRRIQGVNGTAAEEPGTG